VILAENAVFAGSATFGTVTGSLTVDHLSGTISVTDRIDGIDIPLKIGGDVAAGAEVDIADITGTGIKVRIGHEGTGPSTEFAGDLVFGSALDPWQEVHIWSNFSGKIDLCGNDIGGFLLIPGGGSGDVLNVGTITEDGCLALAEGRSRALAR
jgi:hypothetical protein